MIRRLFIFALLPLSLPASQQVGWLCRITLRQTKVTEIQNPNGTIGYGVSDTGNRFYLIKFLKTDSTYSPSLADLGYVENMQLDGSPMPQNKPGDYYLVTTPFVSIRVPTDANFDTSLTRNLGPIYNSSAGDPYTSSDGWYTGFNNSFDNASITPLQGQSGDKWITYTSDGVPQLSDSPSVGNHWTFDEDTGSWVLRSNDTSTGTTDLTPVITAIDGVKTQIQSDNIALREALIDWLGANGNSWVRDCKLSLDDLKSLVTSLGGSVDSIVNSVGRQTVILTTLETISSDNGRYLSFIDNKLSTLSTVVDNGFNDVGRYFDHLLSAVEGFTFYDYNGKLDDIISKLGNIDDNISDGDLPSSVLPLPELEDGDPDDEIPLHDWKDNFNNRNQFAFNQMVAWGSSPSVALGSRNYDVVSGFLTRMIGNIPSVGSDPHMFDVDFDLPFVGHIFKSFSFEDYPSINYFRTAMLWVLYLFFALAMSRLIFDTFI